MPSPADFLTEGSRSRAEVEEGGAGEGLQAVGAAG